MATFVTGIGTGSVQSFIIEDDVKEVLQKVAEIRGDARSCLVNELIREHLVPVLEEEIKANIRSQLPRNSIGHLMNEFYKEIENEKEAG